MSGHAIGSVTYTGMVLNPFTPTVPSGFSAPQPQAFLGEQAVGYAESSSTNSNQAFLWSAPSGVVQLSPAGSTASEALATNGSQQVGLASGNNFGDFGHAMLWSGTAASAIDLNPTGYHESQADGIGGGQVVGQAYLNGGGAGDAMLWTDGADSAVDLSQNPGMVISVALATDGSHQVGDSHTTLLANTQFAAMWSGTAASIVDLEPAGFTDSIALGVGGGQEVGTASTTPFIPLGHAFLWSGTAASAVDLNPAGFSTSVATATNGTIQIGEAGNQAFLWSGTAESAIDLQSLLPANDTWKSSSANSIDATGNIYGIARDAMGNSFVVEWSVPEPTSIGLLAVGAMGLLARRRRKLNGQTEIQRRG